MSKDKILRLKEYIYLLLKFCKMDFGLGMDLGMDMGMGLGMDMGMGMGMGLGMDMGMGMGMGMGLAEDMIIADTMGMGMMGMGMGMGSTCFCIQCMVVPGKKLSSIMEGAMDQGRK